MGLLLLQMRYIEQMVKMRKEQFDESVVRSLNQASRNLEQNETFRYLENFTRDNLSPSSDSLPKLYMGGAVGTADASNGVGAAHGGEKIYSDFELHTIVKHPSTMPKVLRIERNNSIDEATRSFQEYVKNAYVYHKGLLDEVIYTILYKASEKPLEERINFKLLDQDILMRLKIMESVFLIISRWLPMTDEKYTVARTTKRKGKTIHIPRSCSVMILRVKSAL